MNLIKAVNLLNSKEFKVQEVADQFGVSKDLLSDVLKEYGYRYDQSTKLRKFVGEGDPENVDLEEVLRQRKSGKKGNKTSSTNRRNVKKIDANASNENLSLTPEEIKFVKSLFNGQRNEVNDNDLSQEFSMLPLKEETKKITYEINYKIYEEFEKFAEKNGKPRSISRNTLVEIAMQRLMREFGE